MGETGDALVGREAQLATLAAMVADARVGRGLWRALVEGGPQTVAQLARRTMADGGTVIVMDERAGETIQVGDPTEQFFGCASVLRCLPQSRVVADCEAPGTVMRPAVSRASPSGPAGRASRCSTSTTRSSASTACSRSPTGVAWVRMRRVLLAFSLIATLTVAGLAPATAAFAHHHHRTHHHGGGGTSGVRGVVTAGPVCPVEQFPPDPNCADKPISARVIVTRGSGGSGAVASGLAGSDGTFQIAVAPGHYTITAKTQFAMRCDTVPVAVTAGAFTDVNVPCDTGIR